MVVYIVVSLINKFNMIKQSNFYNILYKVYNFAPANFSEMQDFVVHFQSIVLGLVEAILEVAQFVCFFIILEVLISQAVSN